MTISKTVHLIIGDDATRHSLEILLQYEGYRVNAYASVPPFLAAIDQTDNGCILTTVKLPGISGLDLLVLLKERGIDMPVIVTSGFPDPEFEITARNLGAVAFFATPLDPEILLAAIRDALSRSRG